MAQVARAAPAGAASGVVGGRLAAGSRNVATVNATPVEALGPKVGVSQDEGALLFQDYGRGGGPPGRGSPPPAAPILAGLNSQALAAIFEIQQGSGTGAVAGTGAASFGGLLARAIAIYETNARVISGTHRILGGSLNLHL